MQIKKNIAATLRKAMNDRGMTLMEFSQELGIPRTTTQDYLNERTTPRGDTLEFIAQQLGISVAALVSGPEYAEFDGIACLERVFLEIQMLHPDAQPIAKDALHVLRFAFSMSDNLLNYEAKEILQENNGGTYRYIVHELWNPFRQSSSYRLLVKEKMSEGWVTTALVGAFSKNKTAVAQLASKCTQLQLDPEQLLDVIHDFMTKESLLI